MAYKVGGFDFPTVTGSYTVDLDIEPVGVIMVGGNQGTVSALLTGLSGPCVWMSLNGGQLGGGGLFSMCFAIQSKTVTPSPYVAIRAAEIPISVPANGTNPNTIDYRANSITFTPNGFTLNVTHAAPGRRPVHYIAFGEDDLDAAAVQGEFGSPERHDTYPFTPSTLMTMGTDFAGGTLLNSGIFEGAQTVQSYFQMGSGNYPEGSSTWQDTRTHTMFAQGRLSSSVGREGFLEDHIWHISDENPDGLIGLPVLHPLTVLISLIENYKRYRPDPIGENTLITNGGGFSGLAATALVWNGHGWCAGASTPATYSAPVFLDPNAIEFGEFKAVLFTSINGPIATASAWQTRLGYGVLGEDYQGCVTMGEDGSFYQSDSECAANVKDAAGGVKSSIGEIDGDTFSLSVAQGAGFTGTWQAWGEEEDTPVSWQRRRYIGALP